MTQPYISIKWPALVVIGEPVTKDQAAEILVRTASWPTSSNAHKEDGDLNMAAGFPREGFFSWDNPDETFEDRQARWSWIRARCAELGVLKLNYLRNSRITSAWIGGPHGWCDWDGNISTHEYNIGKWPSLEEVTQEWELIARAFPFLTLRAQVLDTENCGGDDGRPGNPTAEWKICGGKVEISWPDEILIPPVLISSANTQMLARFSRSLYFGRDEVGARVDQVARGAELALVSPTRHIRDFNPSEEE